MKKYVFIFFLLIVISGIIIFFFKKISLYECNDSIGCLQIAKDQPINFAILQALTGKVASLGNEQIRGIELAVLNRKGQILGHPVKFQKEKSFGRSLLS